MPLVTINELTIAFRGPPLLDGVSCRIEPGERIGLLGRNGAGKTTFMRLLAQDMEHDGGEIAFAQGAKVAWLRQDVPTDMEGTVRQIVEQGAAALPQEQAWKAERGVRDILSRMELPTDARFEGLSSGMKRRVLLARALACDPDLLLLDEPTNHLDLEAIAWLEEFLAKWQGTLMFVTHDRVFLRKLATRILEIDRGRLFDWACDYETFLIRKEAALAAEEKQNALFDKRLAEEEVWIRQGIKARRTRNEGRVRALEQMRRQRGERRDATGRARLAIQDAGRGGVLVAEAENISFRYGDRPIFQNFSTTIVRGDKIGVLGPNGAGKTTLLRVMLGELPPESGRVRTGTNLHIAYFDQLRQQLNEEASVQDNVADGYDTIRTEQGSRHVIGYLQDFLFSPDRARTLVKFLSGGERNRLLLARLFAKPANVIVLDEPTNDLDAETLELLESRLVEFGGTVLVVSHDREFLNNVVTSTIVFENEGIKEYDGGYDDWLRQRAPRPAVEETKRAAPRERAAPADTTPRARKLTFKERQEKETLPGRIESIETEIATLHQDMARPTFYQQPGATIAQAQTRLKTLEAELATAYSRWETLEGIPD